ncbi:MAG TPA: S8 family serine peptidase [Gaiellaceae bacterium]|nr:S8 family serine peptidase [Gaiellaceae bacterium]
MKAILSLACGGLTHAANNEGDPMTLIRRSARILIVSLLFSTLSAGGALGATTADGTRPATYILVAADNSLPTRLAQEVEARGGSITYELPEIGVAIASSADAAFATSASSIAGLQDVVPDVAASLDTQGFANPPTSTEDDRFFNMQWALDAIDAPEAWSTGAHGAGARVFVLDSGIDTDHPDLSANLNLALSTSFIPGTPVAAAPAGPSFSAPPHHGTWVAGIIAAADNGIGTIGVAPQAEIVAVRICPDSGRGCPDSALLAGLVYAAQNGADVINLSVDFVLSRRGFTDAQGHEVTAADVATLLVAWTRAIDLAHSRGATIVGVAGNQARDLDADTDVVHLAQLPHVIATAATGPRGWAVNPATDLDLPACYSNYGTSVVDLAAPGGNIDGACTFPPPPPWSFCRVVVTLPCFAFDAVVGPTVDGWSVNVGTSAAAPHVAGVAALVVGAHGGTMDPNVVEAVLRASADDLGKPGVDDFYGQGRVNAARAVGLP